MPKASIIGESYAWGAESRRLYLTINTLLQQLISAQTKQNGVLLDRILGQPPPVNKNVLQMQGIQQSLVLPDHTIRVRPRGTPGKAQAASR